MSPEKRRGLRVLLIAATALGAVAVALAVVAGNGLLGAAPVVLVLATAWAAYAGVVRRQDPPEN